MDASSGGCNRTLASRAALAGLILIGGLALASACRSERIAGSIDGDSARADSSLSAGPFVVSNALHGMPLYDVVARQRASLASDSIAYVSLPAGARPNAVSAIIRNSRRSSTVSLDVVDGGFDPVAVFAKSGDSLSVVLGLADGTSLPAAVVVVPAGRRPVVVRTSPPPKRRDVPWNTSVIVVFSEPMDSTTITDQSVQLRSSSGLPIAGRLSAAGDGVEFVLQPDQPLAPSTPYELTVSATVSDLSGDRLGSVFVTSFTTAAPGTLSSVAVSPTITEVLSAAAAGRADSANRSTLLTATVLDASGAPLSATVTWSTSDSTVVRVDAAGRVLGMAPGSATIAADAGGARGTATITVLAPIGSLGISVPPMPSGGLPIDSVGCFTLVPRDPSGNGPVAGYRADWQIQGDLTIVSTAGYQACVRGTAPGSGVMNVVPRPPHAPWTISAVAGVSFGVGDPASDSLASFSVTPTSATVQQGSSVQLFPLAYIADGRQTNRYQVTWTSSDTSIATVVPDAWNSVRVVGIAPGGPVIITAMTNTRIVETRSVPITVVPPPPPVSGLVFSAVSAGTEHACGIATSGAAYCWGGNTFGQLGDGGRMSSTIPVAVSGGLTFASISAGDSETCALTTAGAAYCWGYGGDWGLGDGTGPSVPLCGTDAGAPRGCTPAPAAVAGGLTFSSISAGKSHICGVTTGGTGYCWGWPSNGALGIDESHCLSNVNFCGFTPEPVAGGLSFRSIMAGDESRTCGVTAAGAAYCWGFNYFGELGIGTAIGWGNSYSTEQNTTGPETCEDLDMGLWVACSRSPIAVVGGLAFSTVSAPGNFVCGVAAGGAAYCWGLDDHGQLADGSNTNESRPVPVVGGLTLASISGAFYGGFTCGVTTTGRAYCWGVNADGQLGNGTRIDAAAPAAVAGGLTFTSVSAGGHYWRSGGFSCGLTTAGAVYCWGDNSLGQLGSGTTVGSAVPVRVAGQ